MQRLCKVEYYLLWYAIHWPLCDVGIFIHNFEMWLRDWPFDYFFASDLGTSLMEYPRRRRHWFDAVGQQQPLQEHILTHDCWHHKASLGHTELISALDYRTALGVFTQTAIGFVMTLIKLCISLCVIQHGAKATVRELGCSVHVRKHFANDSTKHVLKVYLVNWRYCGLRFILPAHKRNAQPHRGR